MSSAYRTANDASLALVEVERRHVVRVVESMSGNLTAAAKRLGVNRGTLNRKMKEWKEAGYAPDPDEHRPGRPRS